jgi:hypothetical protein
LRRYLGKSLSRTKSNRREPESKLGIIISPFLCVQLDALVSLNRYFIFIYIENYYCKCPLIIRGNNFNLLHPSLPFPYPFSPPFFISFIPHLPIPSVAVSLFTSLFLSFVPFLPFLPFLCPFSPTSYFPLSLFICFFLSFVFCHSLFPFLHTCSPFPSFFYVHSFLLSLWTPFFFSLSLISPVFFSCIPFPSLLSFILSHCTLHPFITSPLKHRIMICRPFLGSELASALQRRGWFLETNWLRNTFSMDTKTESCELVNIRPLLWNLTHVSAATDKHRITEELLEMVISIRFVPKL